MWDLVLKLMPVLGQRQVIYIVVLGYMTGALGSVGFSSEANASARAETGNDKEIVLIIQILNF